jgi:hypothetical protein
VFGHLVEPAASQEAARQRARAYPGLTVFTSCFLNYAATELDVPTGPAAPVLR